MTQRLKIARENENEKVVRATERIMLREESLNTWGRLKLRHAIGDQLLHPGAPLSTKKDNV